MKIELTRFMEELFPSAPVWPAGFSYHPDFLTVEEEATLLDEISSLELHTFKFQGYEAKRRTASFGYDYSFERRSVSPAKQIPPGFKSLVESVASHLNTNSSNFAELLVTEYPAGSVINWHRDAPPFGLIAGVSLLSDCIFRLRPHDQAKRSRKTIISIPVKRRSLYCLQGVVRNDWQHSTSPVPSTRYSITLRTLRK